MLTRRALIASTAALAAGCSSIESAFNVPSESRILDLTWASGSYGGFRVRGLGSNGLEETLKQIVAALEEDTENPNGPVVGRYTLTPRYLRSEKVDPPLKGIDELIAWYGGLRSTFYPCHHFLPRCWGSEA